jgi:hypothetical protein
MRIGILLAFLLIGLASAASATGSPWQQDSYANSIGGSAACQELCVGLSPLVFTTLAHDTTSADVHVFDITRLPVPFFVRITNAEGDILSKTAHCGSATGLAIPSGGLYLEVYVTPLADQLSCDGVQASTGYVRISADGSWEPASRPCALPLDRLFNDPDCV